MPEVTLEEPLAGYTRALVSSLVDAPQLRTAILQAGIDARIETNHHNVGASRCGGLRERVWKTAHPRSYRESREIIAQIKRGAGTIQAEFRVDPEYDLADELIGAYGEFVRAKKRPSMSLQLGEDKKSLERVRRTGAIWDKDGTPIATPGVVMDLTLRGGLESLDNPRTSRERGKLRATIRKSESLNTSSAGGNYPDWQKNRLARTLASIYYQGTGKLPASAQKNNRWRGAYMRFARSCLALFGIELTNKRLSDQMLAMRNHLKKIKRAGGSITR